MAGVTRRTVRVVVRGMVQGVGFRWFVRERARALGLSGWVRNKADGSVELVAAGVAQEVETFLGVLRAGPPQADVRECDVADMESSEVRPDQFDIR